MSYRYVTEVVCDNCGTPAQLPSYTSKVKGWIKVGITTNLDVGSEAFKTIELCPRCATLSGTTLMDVASRKTHSIN